MLRLGPAVVVDVISRFCRMACCSRRAFCLPLCLVGSDDCGVAVGVGVGVIVVVIIVFS